MARKRSAQPTDVELAILRVLWELGPGSVRQVHEALQPTRSAGYSTTLKMMQVMLEKGVLTRDDSRRPQIYAPSATQEQTQSRLVDDLVKKAFGGATRKLVLRAVQSECVTAKELSEIRKLLDQLKGGKS